MRRIATTLYAAPDDHFTAARLIKLLTNVAERKEEHSFDDRLEFGRHPEFGPFVTIHCQEG